MKGPFMIRSSVHAQPGKVFRKVESQSAAARLKTLCLSVPFLALFLGALPAAAFTDDDANTIMDSYNKAFYEPTASGGNYKETQTQPEIVFQFWTQAEEIEGMLDAYERSWSPEYKSKVTALLQDFIAKHGDDWSGNKFNDDCLWACIAFSRAYLDTGTASFKEAAQKNFDMVYARAWDDTLGGGLWWTTEKTTKSACVNGPGALVAYLVYLSTGDPGYLTKATDIYNWEKAHLFSPSAGVVYNEMHADGVVAPVATTYNQGTFVGAANYLGDVKDAALAADCTMRMGGAGPGDYRLMPDYGIDDGKNGNNSGFNGIAMRWIAKFMKDHHHQSSYLRWLQANANAAWKGRRASDNLSWCEWEKPTPADTNFHSWDCISSVVALQVVPPNESGSSSSMTQDGLGDSDAK
jgi:predicted alpha-1,6-mannanase (GH76 family)